MVDSGLFEVYVSYYSENTLKQILNKLEGSYNPFFKEYTYYDYSPTYNAYKKVIVKYNKGDDFVTELSSGIKIPIAFWLKREYFAKFTDKTNIEYDYKFGYKGSFSPIVVPFLYIENTSRFFDDLNIIGFGFLTRNRRTGYDDNFSEFMGIYNLLDLPPKKLQEKINEYIKNNSNIEEELINISSIAHDNLTKSGFENAQNRTLNAKCYMDSENNKESSFIRRFK